MVGEISTWADEIFVASGSLSSSMSARMEKRALDAIERNKELLAEEVNERRKYA